MKKAILILFIIAIACVSLFAGCKRARDGVTTTHHSTTAHTTTHVSSESASHTGALESMLTDLESGLGGTSAHTTTAPATTKK
ncbi:MAG: hypothetical protein FWF08_00245 [Oscillospiraceae bacterium]|nr:hypothetical protein [Oscillospiraceae bacterium]